MVHKIVAECTARASLIWPCHPKVRAPSGHSFDLQSSTKPGSCHDNESCISSVNSCSIMLAFEIPSTRARAITRTPIGPSWGSANEMRNFHCEGTGVGATQKTILFSAAASRLSPADPQQNSHLIIRETCQEYRVFTHEQKK